MDVPLDCGPSSVCRTKGLRPGECLSSLHLPSCICRNRCHFETVGSLRDTIFIPRNNAPTSPLETGEVLFDLKSTGIILLGESSNYNIMLHFKPNNTLRQRLFSSMLIIKNQHYRGGDLRFHLSNTYSAARTRLSRSFNSFSHLQKWDQNKSHSRVRDMFGAPNEKNRSIDLNGGRGR